MTQEEKAKQYDEVLEKAKSWYVDAQIDFKKTLEALFPTIKENEDERVRKAIISGMKALQEKGKYTEFAHIPMDEVFTWLEKQGKKKLDDEVEPKFHKGEWIVFNGLTLYIKEVVNGYYRTISFDGINNSYVWDIDNIARLWTIQDARDGDVLCCESGWTCIFKTLNSDNISFSSYCFMDNTGWFCETGSESHTLEKAFIKAYNGEIYPATKEQRDILFQKMKKEGYVWVSQKKELRKVEQNPTEWSDEDERNMQNIDSVLFYDRKLPEDTCVKLRNFLKTLKERIGWKPSEEQISSLRDVIYSLPHQPVLFTLYNDLKKLKGE